MAFLVKALFFWNKWQLFSIFFSISRNFAIYYLHAKFQTTGPFKQKSQGEGDRIGHTNLPKPGLFRVKLFFFVTQSIVILKSTRLLLKCCKALVTTYVVACY